MVGGLIEPIFSFFSFLLGEYVCLGFREFFDSQVLWNL
jgi:hypothetical protein